MKEVKIKIALSLFFILSHFGLMLYIIYLHFYKDWLGKEDFEASISILGPIFATITTVIIKYIIDNKNKSLKQSRKVNYLFVFVSFLLPILFVLVIFFIIDKQTKSPIVGFIALLGMIESLFGVYIGFIVKSLFELKEPEKDYELDYSKDKAN
ncbi:hypothetical protein LCGC14_0710540 [marine sediment metagenome]|uniref:Uncharacterized protein n=2 Tax=root TaxID=1 RepID=A0A831QM99_9FLAO|nr:hypothetical protein [Pricia antarctica]